MSKANTATQQKNTKQTTIGIIGYGRFGALVARELVRDFPILVYDTKQRTSKKSGTSESGTNFRRGSLPSITFMPLRYVCQSDYLILCVPISRLEDALLKIKTFVKPPTIVIDVCSVKEYPVMLMKTILPKNIGIVATHPLFGPDSAATSIEGKKMVMHKVRLDKRAYQQIQDYLTKKGLICIPLSPKEHDRLIAESQVLTHVIGRALQIMKAKKTPIDTEAYERLLYMCEVVQYDTLQLFRDMNQYNRFTPKMRAQLRNALQKIERWLSHERRISRN